MKFFRKKAILWIILGTFLLLGIVGAYFLLNLKNKPVADNTDLAAGCISYFTIGRNYDSPSLYPKKILVVDIDKANYEAINEDFNRFNNDYFLYKGVDRHLVILNKKYFSNGEPGSVFEAPSEKEIGIFNASELNNVAPRKVVEFFLKAEIIETFQHIKANICLSKEEDSVNYYQAFFKGRHFYCTNRCQSEDYQFSIKINKNNGRVNLLTK